MKRDQSMWYAYVVSRPKSSDPQPWPHGLTPALSVVTVPITSSISILASPVPAELFLPSEDQAWITDAAMAHHQVVLAGHLRGDVLPLQFGTVFRNQEEPRSTSRNSPLPSKPASTPSQTATKSS